MQAELCWGLEDMGVCPLHLLALLPLCGIEFPVPLAPVFSSLGLILSGGKIFWMLSYHGRWLVS